MNNEEKKVELKEEELEQVNGGTLNSMKRQEIKIVDVPEKLNK